MNTKAYNISIGALTIMAWLGWVAVLVNFDPTVADIVVFLLFYLFLFLATLGTFALLGFWWRQVRSKQRIFLKVAALESFRQSIIISAAIVFALWLQSMRLLYWWNILLLVLAASAVELVILIFKNNSDKNPSA